MALPGLSRSVTPPPLPPTTGTGGTAPVQPKKSETGGTGGTGRDALIQDKQQPKTPTTPPSGNSTPELPPTRVDFSQFSDIISTIVNLLSGGVDILKMGQGINTAVSRDFTANPLTDAEKTKYALTPEEKNGLTAEQQTTAIQNKVIAANVKTSFAGLDTLFEKIFGAGNSLTEYVKNNGGDVATLIADISLSIATGKPLSSKSIGILIGALGLLATEISKGLGLDKEIQKLLTNAGLTPAEAKSLTDFIMGATLLISSGVLGGDMSQAMKTAGLDNTLLSLVSTMTKDGAFNLSPESLQKLLDKLDPKKPGNIRPDLQNVINSTLVAFQKIFGNFNTAVQDSAPQQDYSGGMSA